MSMIRSSTIPVAIAFVLGVIVTAAFFINVPALSSLSELIQTWAVIIAGFALGLGVLNMVQIHGNSIAKKEKGQWIYSIVFLVFFVAQTLPGLADIGKLANPIYVWLYTNVFGPLSAAMYATLGFFIVSAGYRAVRARNVDAALLLVTAVVVMLMNAPVGASIWSGFPGLGKWVMDVPSAAGNRAILIGAGIGGIILAIRVLLGYERRFLGGR